MSGHEIERGIVCAALARHFFFGHLESTFVQHDQRAAFLAGMNPAITLVVTPMRRPNIISRGSVAISVVRFDVNTQQPVRTTDGFCIKCNPDEPGEVIGRILNDSSKPGNRFEGYAAENQNENKILRDVFRKGDAWFRTGDLMRKDKDGYFYFVDRVGDTFRWKGENVSTSEVSEAITTFPGIVDANVYGVSVHGRDGRAGMAAVVCSDRCDLEALHAHLSKALPEYARPVFVRVQSQIDVTGTFKQKKVDLVKQGFDPTLIVDPIYFNDPATRSFVRLDPDLHERIESGNIRL